MSAVVIYCQVIALDWAGRDFGVKMRGDVGSDRASARNIRSSSSIPEGTAGPSPWTMGPRASEFKLAIKFPVVQSSFDPDASKLCSLEELH